jgi:hypothetical protein
MTVANPADGLLANDSDGDDDSFTVDVANVMSVTPGGPLGTFDVNPDGTFNYVNTQGSPGDVDRYQYRIVDQTGLASTTVEVTFVLNQSEYQNPLVLLTEDVNADGYITAIDALRIVNFLGRRGASEVAVSEIGASAPDFLDVNGNGYVSALDALIVINKLRVINDGESGEQLEDVQSDAAPVNAVTTSVVSSSSVGQSVDDVDPAAEFGELPARDKVLAAGFQIAPVATTKAVDLIVERSDSSAWNGDLTDDALSAVLDEWEVQDQLD